MNKATMQNEMRNRLVELFYENNVRCDQTIEHLVDDVMSMFKNGVIVLPCEIGSEIYMLVTRHTTSFEFDNGKMIRRENKHTIVKKTTFTKSNFFKVIEDFGKTVFLTKEEAEQKLKGGAEQ